MVQSVHFILSMLDILDVTHQDSDMICFISEIDYVGFHVESSRRRLRMKVPPEEQLAKYDP